MLANDGKLGYYRVTCGRSKCHIASAARLDRDRITPHQSYFSQLLRRQLTIAYLPSILYSYLQVCPAPFHSPPDYGGTCIAFHPQHVPLLHRPVGNFSQSQSFHLLGKKPGSRSL